VNSLLFMVSFLSFQCNSSISPFALKDFRVLKGEIPAIHTDDPYGPQAGRRVIFLSAFTPLDLYFLGLTGFICGFYLSGLCG